MDTRTTHAVLIESLQILKNKAAKLKLDAPPLSTATEATEATSSETT